MREEEKLKMPYTRRKIRIETQKEVMRLIQILETTNDDFRIENFDGSLKVNAKSILGVLYASAEFQGDTYLVNITTDGFFSVALNECF